MSPRSHCWYDYPGTLSRTHYNDVIMDVMVSQITSLTIVYSTAFSGADQRKHQSSASLAFVRRIHHSPLKWPVTRKMFPFDDVIMQRPYSKWHLWLSVVVHRMTSAGFHLKIGLKDICLRNGQNTTPYFCSLWDLCFFRDFICSGYGL